MTLLKHGDFEFKNILSGGYNIQEDEPKVIAEIEMADGSVRRNYGDLPKTFIEVKFGRLNKKLYVEYMSHFKKDEEFYTYFSPNEQKMITKKFFVKRPKNSLLNINESNQTYDEFVITLEQCGGEK